MHKRHDPEYKSGLNHLTLIVCLLSWLAAEPLATAADATVKGSLAANGETVELPHVYMWAEDKGFYDPADPTWNLLFVERALKPQEIGEHIWDAAWVQIGITQTAEFTDQPELRVYSQSIRFASDSGGNVSGGTYPKIELQGLGSDAVSGRVWHVEPQKSFDDSYQYDFSFSTSISAAEPG